MEVQGENVAMIQERKTLEDKRVSFQGKTDAPLFAWPWENLGNYKYLFYIALLAKYFYSREETKESNWCFHFLLLGDLRAHVYQLWSSHNMMLFCNGKRRISQEGIDYKQIDAQWHWDNFLTLQAIVALLAYFSFPSLSKLPFWDARGIICCLAFHIGISEPLYYWLHRLLHSSYFFSHYHWQHHSSKVPHPHAAGHASFLEHLLLVAVIGVPTLGTAFVGYGSIIMMYSYILLFDFLRCLGHSNVEVVPHRLFEIIPVLKYLIYTPTYHNIHHTDMKTNFCLFMPLYDILGKTINFNSWDLQKEISSRTNERVPDFVFLAHIVDIMSAMHAPFVFLSFNSIPFTTKFFLIPMWPFTFLVMLAMWAKSKTFLFSFYNLRGRLHQTWIVPRFGFQVTSLTLSFCVFDFEPTTRFHNAKQIEVL